MYTEFKNKCAEICFKVGEFQLQNFGKIAQGQIEDKGINQLVSFVDVESEKMLVAFLAELIPNCGFITEENTVESVQNKEWIWVIDPLDGTTNFLHGLPAFSISVGLLHQGTPVAGVVYAPYWGEMFTAAKNAGAFLNDQPIYVSETAALKSSLIATGFPYYQFQNMPEYLEALKELMQNTHGLRRMGSAAIDLAYTACGRFDGFYESGLSSWDIAAGVLLVQEAGGVVTDFAGGDNYLFGNTILASSKSIYPSFQSIIKKHLT